MVQLNLTHLQQILRDRDARPLLPSHLHRLFLLHSRQIQQTRPVGRCFPPHRAYVETEVDCDSQRHQRFPMLFTIAAVLVILWLLGLVSSYTIGGFIHILLVCAIILVLIRIIQGRKPLA